MKFAASFLLISLAAACGESDDPVDQVDSPPPIPMIDAEVPEPGKVTVVSPTILGNDGRVVVIMALDGTTRVAGACLTINGDPAAVAGNLLVPNQPTGDPCDLGAEAVLDPGSYDISAGIYNPGEMTPLQCSDTTVAVDGNSNVTLPAFGTCN